MSISLLTPEQLEPLYQEATAKQTEAQWKKKFLTNAVRILRDRPLTYRGYGPYWWGFKKLLIEQGLLPESNFLDAEWLEKVKYEKESDTILAAFAYHNERESFGNFAYDQNHKIELETEDGEESDIVDYVLIDDDLELMHVAKSMS